MLAYSENLGVAFSQNAWAAAQQEGCLGCPDRYPKWPAKKTYARINTPEQLIIGEDPDFAVDETPFLQKYTRPKILKQAIACTENKFIPSWPDENPNGYAEFSMKNDPRLKKKIVSFEEEKSAQPPRVVPDNTVPALPEPQITQPPRVVPDNTVPALPEPFVAQPRGVVPGNTVQTLPEPHLAQQRSEAQPRSEQRVAPPKNLQTAEAASESPGADDPGLGTMLSLIGNSCRGIAYDLQNWSNIEAKDLNGKSKWHHVFFRDNRFVEILFMLLISLVLAIILYLLFGPQVMKKYSSGVPIYYTNGAAVAK